MMSNFVPLSSGGTVKESILDPLSFLLSRIELARSRSEVRAKAYRVFAPRQWVERCAGRPSWVKVGRTRSEQMSYGLASKADIAQCSWYVANGPTAEVVPYLSLGV
jgi:hypothetical protein